MSGLVPGGTILAFLGGGALGMFIQMVPGRIITIDEVPARLRDLSLRWNSPQWWVIACYPFLGAIAFLGLGVMTWVFYLRSLPSHVEAAIFLWAIGLSCNLGLVRSALELLFKVSAVHGRYPWNSPDGFQRLHQAIRHKGALRLALSAGTIAASVLLGHLLGS